MGLDIGAISPEEIAISVVGGNDRRAPQRGIQLALAFDVGIRRRDAAAALAK